VHTCPFSPPFTFYLIPITLILVFPYLFYFAPSPPPRFCGCPPNGVFFLLLSLRLFFGFAPSGWTFPPFALNFAPIFPFNSTLFLQYLQTPSEMLLPQDNPFICPLPAFQAFTTPANITAIGPGRSVQTIYLSPFITYFFLVCLYPSL